MVFMLMLWLLGGLLGLHRIFVGRVISGFIMLALFLVSLFFKFKYNNNWPGYALLLWYTFDFFWMIKLVLDVEKRENSEDNLSEADENFIKAMQVLKHDAIQSEPDRKWPTTLKYNLAMRMLAAPKSFIRQARERELQPRLSVAVQKAGGSTEDAQQISSKYLQINGRDAIVVQMPKVQHTNEAHYIAMITSQDEEAPTAFLLEELHESSKSAKQKALLIQVNRTARATHDIEISNTDMSTFINACEKAIKSDGNTMSNVKQIPLGKFEKIGD